MNSTFTICDKCSKEIKYGEKYFYISKSFETANRNIITLEDEIEINDQEELVTLCRGCGNIFNANNILTIIKSIPFSENQIINN